MGNGKVVNNRQQSTNNYSLFTIQQFNINYFPSFFLTTSAGYFNASLLIS